MKEKFKCFFCGNDADRIVYYSKAYGSKMGRTIENPTLCCESRRNSPRIVNQINPMRGGDEGIFSFKFETIGSWSNKQLAYHLSNKLWEINHLGTKPMRKLVWRIHFVNRKPKDAGSCQTVL